MIAQRLHSRSGFTLLEVMVALAILAITLTVLYGSQSQSISIATEARFNTQASFLIGQKVAELQAGELEPYNAEGDFGDDYPQYRWKMIIDDVMVTEPEAFEDVTDIRKVTFTVSWVDTAFAFSLVYYYFNQE